MPTALNRHLLTLLAGLLLVLAGIATTFVARRQAAVDSPPSSGRSAARTDKSKTQPESANSTETVKLDALTMARPNPVEGERNPFRFGARGGGSPPPRPASTNGRSAGPGPAGPTPGAAPGPAGPPPIQLKFIGIVDAPAQGGKLAVLSDGRSVFYGHENEVIDGRLKIVRIGVESIELTSVDGRGRQTIRLSGQ